jgi:hypothetical protein
MVAAFEYLEAGRLRIPTGETLEEQGLAQADSPTFEAIVEYSDAVGHWLPVTVNWETYQAILAAQKEV